FDARGAVVGGAGGASLFGGHRLYPYDLKALAATNVLAADNVVLPHHVGFGFGEAGKVLLVGVSGRLLLFVPDEPGELIFAGLVAVRADQGVGPHLRSFVKKVAFLEWHMAQPPTENSILPHRVR